MLTKRGTEFSCFAELVGFHIENYTVLQYGDAPNDQVQEWTENQCMDSIKRYGNRFESNARGRIETLRDMLKIAHFAGLIFGKLNPTEEEIKELAKGGY